MNLDKLFICALVLFSACEQKTQVSNVPESFSDACFNQLVDGDIVLRRGKDEISNLFAKMSAHNQQYSHCAVAIKQGNKIDLYHIMAQNATNDFMKESFKQFVNPKSNSAFAIIHLNLDSEKRAEFCKQVVSMSNQNIVFDNEFDLTSDSKMYCSEMIYKAIIASTGDTNFISKTYAVSGKPYIAIDNLYEHKNAKNICEVAY